MKEKLIEKVLLVIACSAIAIIFLIFLFIFIEGLPVFVKTGVIRFIFSSNWAPTKGNFGILPMIIGSILVTFGALVIGILFGLACAILLACFAPKGVTRVLKPLIELLAGIPSVVYGFIGVVVLIPIIRNTLGGPGFSVLAASVILGIMISPTIIAVSLDALRAVPLAYKEGSLALGATQWQTVYQILIPAAKSGIIAGIILGMGRAVGETMAVIMIAGNSLKIPRSPLDPVRTLTSNIALEMGYASGMHQEALFACGVVLFIIIMILNTLALLTIGRRNG
uniref:Phosphate transport system permease protein n=1 Tax=candidate division WOR-3 bacterium TaxID=2052148 RepID=A0A7C6EFC0_UNCW3